MNDVECKYDILNPDGCCLLYQVGCEHHRRRFIISLSSVAPVECLSSVTFLNQSPVGEDSGFIIYTFWFVDKLPSVGKYTLL